MDRWFWRRAKLLSGGPVHLLWDHGRFSLCGSLWTCQDIWSEPFTRWDVLNVGGGTRTNCANCKKTHNPLMKNAIQFREAVLYLKNDGSLPPGDSAELMRYAREMRRIAATCKDMPGRQTPTRGS